MNESQNSRNDLVKKRLVLYMDISGFTDMLLKFNLNEVYEKLKAVTDGAKLTSKVAERYSNGGIQCYTFSDSIIIFSDDIEKEGVGRFVELCYELQRLYFEKGICIKGSIAFGDSICDTQRQIFLGKPIADSVLLQGDLKQFGFVLHHSAEAHFHQIDYKFNWLKRFSGSFSYGKAPHYFVKIQNDYQEIEKLQHQMSGKPRIYLQATLDFMTSNQ